MAEAFRDVLILSVVYDDPTLPRYGTDCDPLARPNPYLLTPSITL